MILRRLSKSIRRQDWFVAVLEVFIVVVGLFIGLQVDDWNTARIEREEGREILAQIEANLQQDIRSLSARQEFWAEILEHADIALAYAERGERGNKTDWELVVSFINASHIWPHNISDTAYAEIENGGGAWADRQF